MTPPDSSYSTVTPPPSSAETWRRLALYLLLFGLIGVGVELALLGHTEDRLQWTPLVLLALGIVSGGAVAVRPTRGLISAFRALMLLYLPASGLGLYLHLKSNVEFELEMRPSMAGGELVMESLTGAIPALAPGTMAQLGLLGLLVCFRHPRSRLTKSPDTVSDSTSDTASDSKSDSQEG